MRLSDKVRVWLHQCNTHGWKVRKNAIAARRRLIVRHMSALRRYAYSQRGSMSDREVIRYFEDLPDVTLCRLICLGETRLAKLRKPRKE